MSKDITPKGMQGPVRKALASGSVAKMSLKSRVDAGKMGKSSLKDRASQGVD